MLITMVIMNIATAMNIITNMIMTTITNTAMNIITNMIMTTITNTAMNIITNMIMTTITNTAMNIIMIMDRNMIILINQLDSPNE